MDKFIEMKTFTEVVDSGSFVKAADTLSMSKAAVSRHVNDLESRLGVRLLHRTTRRLSLTEEGQVFHARCRELLSEIEQAEAEITSGITDASGLVRVNAPVTFGIRHLAPLWGEFQARHPKLTLEVTLSDRVVDLVEEGYDLCVRIADLPNSTLVSKRLATTRLALCASPQYLLARGTPRHPGELAGHAIIAYSYLATRDEWVFDGPQGKVSVRTQPRIRTNNGDTCRAAALAHQGVVLQPTFLVGEDLRAGTLVELMPEYRSADLGIHAVYPTRKHVSPKVRLLIEFLVEVFSAKPWPG